MSESDRATTLDPPARPRPAHPPTALTNRLVRELATWLESPDPARIHAAVEGWGPSTWSALRRVVVMHGLAPHLAHGRPSTPLAAALPPDTITWLAEQDERNAHRIARMHDELAGILSASDAAGIEVMPLKGALLTTLPGADPYRRPMADLDLLVRPADRVAMGAVLRGLDYRIQPEDAPRPTHDVYVDPAGDRIVDVEGEHPDNPRRVEVHVEVKRHLWGWSDDDELTAALWEGARRGTVLGEPATLPRNVSLLAHVAIHASSDLLTGRGRLVQWLDLGALASDPAAGLVDAAVGLPHPRLAFPSLRLAARALPLAMAGLDLSGLAATMPRRLARWAATVPLDARCGLTTGRPPDDPSGFGARWERWRPAGWRLSVAYGATPLPAAVARHAVTVAGRARNRS